MDFKKHFTINWKNYMIAILVIFLLGGNLTSNLLNSASSNFNSKSLSMSDSMYYGESVGRSISYSQNSVDFAPEVEDRKKIKNANLVLETDNYDSAKNSIINTIKAKDGIILRENEYKYKEDYRSLSLNFKINADNLDTMLSEIKTFAEVESLNVYVNDVTGNYVDYNERLVRYETQIVKYEEMLKKEMSIEEEISVQNRIDNLENSIFYLKKQIGSIDEDVSYSDVSISLKEEANILSEIDFLGLKDSFKMFMESLDGAIRFIILAIGFILPFGIIYLIYKISRKVFCKKRK